MHYREVHTELPKSLVVIIVRTRGRLSHQKMEHKLLARLTQKLEGLRIPDSLSASHEPSSASLIYTSNLTTDRKRAPLPNIHLPKQTDSHSHCPPQHSEFTEEIDTPAMAQGNGAARATHQR